MTVIEAAVALAEETRRIAIESGLGKSDFESAKAIAAELFHVRYRHDESEKQKAGDARLKEMFGNRVNFGKDKSEKV